MVPLSVRDREWYTTPNTTQGVLLPLRSQDTPLPSRLLILEPFPGLFYLPKSTPRSPPCRPTSWEQHPFPHNPPPTPSSPLPPISATLYPPPVGAEGVGGSGPASITWPAFHTYPSGSGGLTPPPSHPVCHPTPRWRQPKPPACHFLASAACWIGEGEGGEWCRPLPPRSLQSFFLPPLPFPPFPGKPPNGGCGGGFFPYYSACGLWSLGFRFRRLSGVWAAIWGGL
ncbi:hypothetical protein ACOMHN_031567 [Nucella lapillus]